METAPVTLKKIHWGRCGLPQVGCWQRTVFRLVYALIIISVSACSRVPIPEKPRHAGGQGDALVEMKLLHPSDQGVLPLISISMGKHQGWWLLDTGSSHNLIAPALAARMGLPAVSSSLVGTIGGQQLSTHYRLPEMRIGRIRLKGQSASAVNLESLATPPGISISGILGMPALKDQVVSLDFGQRTVHFSDRVPVNEAAYENIPFRLHDGVPVARQTLLPGRMGDFILDTGNATALVLLPVYSRLPAPEQLQFVESRDLGGVIATHLSKLSRISLGSVTFQRVPVSLPLESRRLSVIDGSIGNTLWGGQNIVFDFPGNRLLIERHQSPQALAGRFGFLLGKGNTVQVVMPDSPANKVGMIPGDRIVAVNGQIFGANAHLIWEALYRYQQARISVLRQGKTLTFDLQRVDYLPLLR